MDSETSNQPPTEQWSARRVLRLVGSALVWLIVVVQMAGVVNAGYGKFESFAGWQHWFQVFGYPAWFSPVVGGLEIIGGLLLLVPNLTSYAALGLLVIMGGAIHATTTHETDLSAIDPMITAIVLIVLIALRWPRRLRGIRHGEVEPSRSVDASDDTNQHVVRALP